MLRTKCPRTSFDRNESDCEIFEQSVAPVVSDKDGKEVWSRVDHHPKLLNQCLSIEEVVGCHKEVPEAILIKKRVTKK